MATGNNNPTGVFTDFIRTRSTRIDNTLLSSSSDTYGSGLFIGDKNNYRIFEILPHQTTSGKIETQIFTTRTINDNEKFNGLNLGIKSDGTFEDSFINTESYNAFINMFDSGLINVPTSDSNYLSSVFFKYQKFGKVLSITGNNVKVTGVTAGSRAKIGTLPVGFRPSGNSAYGNTSDGRTIEIYTNGIIEIQLPSNWTESMGFWFTVVFLIS